VSRERIFDQAGLGSARNKGNISQSLIKKAIVQTEAIGWEEGQGGAATNYHNLKKGGIAWFRDIKVLRLATMSGKKKKSKFLSGGEGHDVRK